MSNHTRSLTLLDHLAVVAPPDQLVGVAVRHLREPARPGGSEYRSLGSFRWVPAAALGTVADSWATCVTPDLVEQWRWVHANRGPAEIARRRHLHGVRLPGVPMLRPVTCARRPANGGGTLDELTGVLALPVDLDVAERRHGDRRPYCPTVTDGAAFLAAFDPTVVLDAGGGLVALWVFDSPAEPHAARRLGGDLVAAVGHAAASRRWAFDSPPPHAAWVKVPGCVDLFYGRTVAELDVTGPRWSFDRLRDAVPFSITRPRASRPYAPEVPA